MAYTKSKTAVNDENREQGVSTEETPSSVSMSYSPRKKIPLDHLVMVKNMTGGKLVYVSKRLRGYSETWYEFGEEVPMEMAELFSMKNTDRRFFTENWIEVDMAVLRDLQMDKFYTDTITSDEIENLFDKDIDVIVKKIEKMSPAVKNCVGIKAFEMVESKKLRDIDVITKLENALDCTLIER